MQDFWLACASGVGENTLRGERVAHFGMPEGAAGDAVQLALAVHYELDYLLTWNCAHLANGERLRLLADFSRQQGIWLQIICTPDEMVREAKEE